MKGKSHFNARDMGRLRPGCNHNVLSPQGGLATIQAIDLDIIGGGEATPAFDVFNLQLYHVRATPTNREIR